MDSQPMNMSMAWAIRLEELFSLCIQFRLEKNVYDWFSILEAISNRMPEIDATKYKKYFDDVKKELYALDDDPPPETLTVCFEKLNLLERALIKDAKSLGYLHQKGTDPKHSAVENYEN